MFSDSESKAFWFKVSKTPTCWLWTRAKIRDGYGIVRIRRRAYRAHRLAWELTHGAIPNGLHVLHRCDVRACVNPEHLFLGTDADNCYDAMSKHRQKLPPVLYGEQHPNHRLTWEAVTRIRALAAEGWTHRPLGAKFGVSNVTIGSILNNRTWIK